VFVGARVDFVWRHGRARISNEDVRRRTDQPPLTHTHTHTHTHTSVPPAPSIRLHTARADPSMDHSRALRVSVAFAKGLEPPIRPIASHLAPDRWIRFNTTQHWSGNGLSSRQNRQAWGNVHHRTSHTMMMMMMMMPMGDNVGRQCWPVCHVLNLTQLIEHLLTQVSNTSMSPSV